VNVAADPELGTGYFVEHENSESIVAETGGALDVLLQNPMLTSRADLACDLALEL
jgi:hypothetical protein